MWNEYCREIEGVFGNRYLLLHRENYVDDPQDVRKVVLRAGSTCSKTAIHAALDHRDWRVRIAGIYCVLGGRHLDLATRLRNYMTPIGFSLLRPACIALFILKVPYLADDCIKFLQRPFDDDVDDRAAAIESLGRIHNATHDKWLQSVTSMLQEHTLSNDCFLRSKDRFARALEFWT